MKKLNKITKKQVADRLVAMLQKQVDNNNQAQKPIPASESNWIKELDARERGEAPFQHISKKTWNLFKDEVGNPLEMRNEFIEWAENPVAPDYEEVVIKNKNGEIHIGIQSGKYYYGYFEVSDIVTKHKNNAINIYLSDLGYDLYNIDTGHYKFINKFDETLKVLENDEQYFEWADNSNTNIIYKYN